MSSDFGIPNVLLSRLTNVATLAALNAGELLKKGFGKTHSVDFKDGRHNLVTEYDRACEELIIKQIKSHFPEHSFLAEESGLEKQDKDSILWVIDPLDGTVNFAHNIPMFAVSIAATYKSQVLAGVTYQPLLNELFIGEKGHGAHLNGKKLSVSPNKILDKAFLATGFPYNAHENPLHCIEHFSHMIKMGIPMRRMGSATLDLAYLATGRYDGFFEVSLSPWDYAAGKIILEEAGGKITDFKGNPIEKLIDTPVVATNTALHEQLITHLKEDTASDEQNT